MSEPNADLRVLDEEPGRFVFLAWKNLTILVWLAMPTADEIGRLVSTGDKRAAEGVGKLSDVHLVARRVGLPDASARNALLTAAKNGAPHLAAVGVWLSGDGFWSSAVRSFVTGLSVIVKGPFDLRMFAELNDLAEWLASVHGERTGVPVEEEELLDVFRRARLHAEQSLERSQAVAN